MKIVVNSGPVIHCHAYDDDNDNVRYVRTTRGWGIKHGDISSLLEHASWWSDEDVHFKFNDKREKRWFLEDMDKEIAEKERLLNNMKITRDIIKKSRRISVWMGESNDGI